MEQHNTTTTEEGAAGRLAMGFEVAGRLVQPRMNRIVWRGEVFQVEPKIMQVLVHLARHAGEPVTREALFDTVWAGTIVSDDVLTRSVSELRKRFDDDPRAPQVIETIPRVGYRLIASVTVPHVGDAATTHAPSPPDVVARPAATPPAPVRRMVRWAWPVVALAVVVAGLVAWQMSRRPRATAPLEARPLTTLPGREVTAALSPSGDRVAFAWSRDDTGADLYVLPVDAAAGAQPLQLTHDDGYEWHPTWSPDGSSIAFVHSEEGECAVLTVPALGGPEERLASCTPGGYPDIDWSPDGQSIVVADRDPGSPYALWRIDAATGRRTALVQADDSGASDYYPRYAPDGRYVAFVRSRGEGRQDIFLAPSEGGAARRLTRESAGIAGIDWSPDGDVLYATDQTSGNSLWRLPLDGGAPTWLPVREQVTRPNVAARSGHLVFERWRNDMTIYRQRAGGNRHVPVAASTRLDLSPSYAPDGKKLAFVSDRSGSFEVWSADVDGSALEQLTHQRAPYASGPRWSPDGLRIAYASYLDGQADVYVIDQPGGMPRRLTTGSADDTTPFWAPDGRWLYFSSNRTGTWEVWKIPAGGGTAIQVTREGGYAPQSSVDGRWLYFTRRGERGLWRMAASGGDVEPVIDTLPSFDARNWSVLSDGVYYLDATVAPELAVRRYDPESGSAAHVMTLGHVVSEGGFAVSPDGQSVLYVQVDDSAADLMLVDGLVPSDG